MMTLEEALEYVPPFDKKHNGKTLGDIAMQDVLYIDWMAGLTDIRSGQCRDAIKLVAAEFVVAIEDAISEREDGR